MPDEQTPTPHLEKLFREVAEDEFWAIRGKTINGYADLEQSLCQLFAFLGGIERDIVGIIFFEITSHQRNSILDRLFKKKFGDQYSLFQNSLTAQLKPIDIARTFLNKVDQIRFSFCGVFSFMSQKLGGRKTTSRAPIFR